MSLYELYCNHFSNWISGGELINRGKLSSLGIRPLFNQIVSKQSIKKVINIEEFPVNYGEKSLVNILNRIIFKNNKDCNVYVTSYSIPENLDINDKVFKNQMLRAEEEYMDYKRIYDSLLSKSEQQIGKEFNLGGGKKLRISERKLRKLRERYESYLYITECNKENRKLARSYVFVEVIAPDIRKMNLVLKEVMNYLSIEEFKYRLITSNTAKFMDNFSPAGYIKGNGVKDFNETMLSNENLSYLVPYKTHGFIGDGRGCLCGIDVGSKTPFILNFFASGGRQISLIAAPAGHGKTMQAMIMVIGMLRLGVHCSVLDVKGSEWNKLAPFTKYVEIDISESSNSYVNILRLNDLKDMDTDDANYFYSSSLKAFQMLIETKMQSVDATEKRDTEYITRVAFDSLMHKVGVDRNIPKTFEYTAELEYDDIIPILESMKRSPSMKSMLPTLESIKNVCVDMFRTSNMFKGREIKLGDIFEAPLVIYSLNKNEDTGTGIEDSLRTVMIAFLDKKKVRQRKKEGKFTSLLYEETQRKDEFPSLIRFICGNVTGARSSNVSVFLLCNSVSALMGEDMRDITSNLNNYFIGPLVSDEDLEDMRKINCGSLIPKIKRLKESETIPKNSFAVKFDTGLYKGECICKAVIPDTVLRQISTREVMS